MTTLHAGTVLPRLSFSQIEAPGRITWSQGPLAPVVFVPHLVACPACDGYLAELGRAVDGLREWATRVLVLAGAHLQLPPGVLGLDDLDRRERAALGLADDQAAVIQADRWGAIYQVEVIDSAASHTMLPTDDDLIRLAKYIDIQCPECGIPSQEWLSASPFPLG